MTLIRLMSDNGHDNGIDALEFISRIEDFLMRLQGND